MLLATNGEPALLVVLDIVSRMEFVSHKLSIPLQLLQLLQLLLNTAKNTGTFHQPINCIQHGQLDASRSVYNAKIVIILTEIIYVNPYQKVVWKLIKMENAQDVIVKTVTYLIQQLVNAKFPWLEMTTVRHMDTSSVLHGIQHGQMGAKRFAKNAIRAIIATKSSSVSSYQKVVW